MQLNDQLVTSKSVHQIIDRCPLRISPDSPVMDAIVLIQEQSNSPEIVNASESLPKSKDRSYVLVVEERHLLGIFTLRDIVRLKEFKWNLLNTKITEVMTKEVITLRESELQDITTVLSILQQHGIHYLPIVDDREELVGIVRESDLLAELDLVKIVGVVESLQKYFQESQQPAHNRYRECKYHNKQTEEVCCKNQNIIHRLVAEKVANEIKINEELQQTLEELQIVEEELRQQNEQLVVAREIVELESRRYQNLFEFTPCGYLVTDQWGNIQQANHAASTLLSVDIKYLVGKPLKLYIAKEDSHTFISRLADLEQFPEWEISIQPRKGEPFPASVKVAPEPGQVEYYGGIGEDITERKLADQTLRESEERLTLALEAVKMGIWDWNMTTNTYIWSAHVGPLYGLPKGSLCPPTCSDFLDLIHPEDIQVFTQELNLAIEQKTEFSVEYRAVWPDGSLHWLSTRGKVYCDKQSQPIRVIGTTRDISDRKQKEQQIYEQAALLDIATDAIFVRDFDTKILFWSRGAERIYGWTQDEAVGKNLQDLFCPKTALQKEVNALKTVIKLGTWQGELRKKTKSGQEIILESRWTLMFDAEGQPKSILVVDTNITERKKLEDQFYRTQRLESIGTLAGGIAHDLNNILTPILTATQLLKGKLAKNPERHPQMLDIIENNAQRGSALVRQVLSFARGLKGEKTIVQVKHLITEIIQIAKQTFPKSIEFSTQIPENLWTVSGDTTQLHQVLMNLVVNAHDAMPAGGMLTITAENMFIDEAYARMNLESKVGHYIVITVTDTGIGISSEILDRIFEPFFTTKEVGTGTGLGLPTALGIIKSHHGFVTVSSLVGKGSTFKVFLPSLESPPIPSLEQLEIEPGKGELILVVDDEPQILDVARMILENNNYQTLTASNGIEAIALYAQYKQEISVVLIDMMMPEMDGVTTIRTMQKMNPDVQVIACSGLGTIELLPESRETKVQAVLLKPYTANDLLHSLNQVMDNGELTMEN
ncbi:PAS domain S-box protein [Sphaerospermopsis torques-reginae]|uniref:histidine kinase n=1 Tax=Sphaerospermopsis torques-reginae ITEP-024 TaxID=984208 RepID=A0ABX8WUZ1_9CYAN|nr:PAS domain S-box protein [Sphaerospermopsis torques-reginae]QYX29956.1 PAS domain S-box protein [Sphaerospermopsis torques-reginae ITEP-024]